MQVGVQGMSDDSYETARKFVKDGALGKVVLAQIDYSRNHKDDFWEYPIDADARPGVNLDWKAWLGSAPKRPFDPDRYFSWRRYWDYSSGIASDLFIHRVTRIIKALDLDVSGLRRGRGRQVRIHGKQRRDSRHAQHPAGLSGRPDGAADFVDGERHGGAIICCAATRRRLQFTQTGFTIRPEGGGEEIVHQKTGAEALDLHHRNLMNAIRKDEPLKCDVDARIPRRGGVRDGRAELSQAPIHALGRGQRTDRLKLSLN